MISARRRGFSLLETIITIALTIIFTAAFTELIVYASRSSRANLLNAEARTNLQNEVEVVRAVARTNWATLADPACAAPNVCHPEASGTDWIFAAGKGIISSGTFTEWLSFTPVFRSKLAFPNQIVASTTAGSVNDSSTKEVSADVTWTDGAFVRSQAMQTYVYHFTN